MADPGKRWGRGRIVFAADLAAIKAELSAAHPMTEIYEKRKERLGISYSAFCRLVARYASADRLAPSGATQPAQQMQRASDSPEQDRADPRFQDLTPPKRGAKNYAAKAEPALSDYDPSPASDALIAEWTGRPVAKPKN